MSCQKAVEEAVFLAVQLILTQTDVREGEAKASLTNALDAVPRQRAVAWLAERDEARAEADRLRAALESIAREYEWSDEPTDWAEHDEPAEYAAANVTAVVNRIALAARAALDAEDGDE